MKLRTKLMFNAVLSLAIIVLIGGVFFYSANEVKKENDKNAVANQISKNVLELNLLTNEYLNLEGEGERVKQQWLLKHESNFQLLESDIFTEKDEIKIINNIRETHSNTQELFLQLSPETSEELKNKIFEDLSIQFQTKSLGSFQLSNLLRAKVEKSQKQSILIFLFLAVLMIGVSFFISRYTISSVLVPISYIMQGTKEIERGNFRARVNLTTGDEIQELGDSFNKTMEALERLEEKRDELEHAKTEFLSITSHELRSPMTPMRAQLQMLKDEYFGKLTPKQYSSIDIVLRNTNRLDKIIMDLLEVSRIEAARLKFNFVKSNLGEHLRRVIEEMSGFMIEKNIQLIPKLDFLPTIKCDPDRIMQVLRNLLENSVKFSKENNRVIINAKKSGEFIQFSVKDFGIGISEESKKRLFEPFFQGEKTIYRKYGGTGLGLAICKGITESQGGKIWFESTLGKGTEFFFTIPLKPVSEIKPIKLLFSSSAGDELKVLNILKEIVGPMAEAEYEILKKNGLNYKKLTKYIDFLKNKNILTEESSTGFLRKINEAYGRPIEDEKPEIIKLIKLTKQREEARNIIQKIILLAFKLYGEIAIKKANTVKGLKADYDGNILLLDKGKEEAILKSLGYIYVDLLGDITRFLISKEALNKKES